MSATSGITVSSDLVDAFAKAVEADDVRFIKVSIRNEMLIPDGSKSISGDLNSDLGVLQTMLLDDVPAYVLVRLDGNASEWLAVSYVPEVAKIRDKMLYASTRASLTRGLGDQRFVDSLFATSKADLTPTAYAAHRRHMTAPNPLSAREAEMERLRSAERAAGTEMSQGMRARKSHVGEIGFGWDQDVEDAVKSLASVSDGSCYLVVLSVETATENLVLLFSGEKSPSEISSVIPTSNPSYAFYSFYHSFGTAPKHDVVFVYSCPSGCPVKPRMMYASGVGVVVNRAKALGIPVTKRIETSDPAEVTESFLTAELGLTGNSVNDPLDPSKTETTKAFSRPKGPGRKR